VRIAGVTWYKMNQYEVWSLVHTIDPSHFAEGLKHNDERVRKHIAKQIGVLRDITQVNNLIEFLAEERDFDVRYEIILALTRIGEPAVPPLMRGLTDENANVRRASAQGLGGMGCVAAIGKLCTATGDQNPSVRKAAVQALGRIGILNDDVEARVLTSLKDDDERVVLNAIFASGYLGCTAAVPRLIAQLDDLSSPFRGFIIEILGEIGDNRATGRLCQLLAKNDSPDESDVSIDDSERGQQIIEALGKIADPRAVQPLIQALIYCVINDDNNQDCDAEDGCAVMRDDEQECDNLPVIREHIHVALTRIGEPAIPPLIETLREWADSEDNDMRSCCHLSVSSEICSILSEFGPLGIETALKLLGDEKASVRKLAVKFFSEERLEEKRALDALVACMVNDPDERVKTLASYRLVDGGPKSFEAIISAVGQLHRPFTGVERDAIRMIGAEALFNLAQGLDDPDEGKRSESLDAIRELIQSSPLLSGMAALGALFR